MALPIGSTEQAYLVSVTVNGAYLGVFDTYAGGDALAKSSKHRPGGMGPEKSYTSLPVFSDIKVSRVLDPTFDWEMIRTLIPWSGRVDGSITVQPLDSDGNVYGNSRTATGVFLGVTSPKIDSNSETPAMFDLDFSITVWS